VPVCHDVGGTVSDGSDVSGDAAVCTDVFLTLRWIRVNKKKYVKLCSVRIGRLP